METNIIYNIDALEGYKNIEDNSIDLVILDPPYNIGKDYWDKIDNYLDWIYSILIESQRVLKSTGSLYLFHNDFEIMSEIQVWLRKNSRFIFRNLIIWNKKFRGCKSEAYMNIAISTKKNRTYRKFSEYCLFYTFDDVTDLDYSKIMDDVYKPYREIIREQISKTEYSWKDERIVKMFLKNGIGKNYAVARQISQNKLNYNYNQMKLLSEEEYNIINPLVNFTVPYSYLKEEYEKLNNKFKKQRKEYKNNNLHKLSSQRYVFNGTKHHSIMNFQTPQDKNHICQKPEEMIDEIISVSSNEGGIILDPFLGSGTTVFSAIKLKRKYIGFEKDKNFYLGILDKMAE